MFLATIKPLLTHNSQGVAGLELQRAANTVTWLIIGRDVRDLSVQNWVWGRCAERSFRRVYREAAWSRTVHSTTRRDSTGSGIILGPQGTHRWDNNCEISENTM